MRAKDDNINLNSNSQTYDCISSSAIPKIIDNLEKQVRH
jgi:hypothetical protein